MGRSSPCHFLLAVKLANVALVTIFQVGYCYMHKFREGEKKKLIMVMTALFSIISGAGNV